MTVHKVETRWLKFLREQKNIKFKKIHCKKSHCSGAMETPETAHEKIGTYMWADCFFALHQFFFFFYFDASNDRFSTVSRHEICRKITRTFIPG